MSFEPAVSGNNDAFDFLLEKLQGGQSFIFCKLNHGFWERLEAIQSLGYDLGSLQGLTDDEATDLESRIGAQDSYFVRSGFLSELLALFRSYEDRKNNFYFASSLMPWPLSDRIEGTPFRPSDSCQSLIEHYVSEPLREQSRELKFTGFEFKQAILTAELPRFLKTIEGRRLLILCNSENRALFDYLAYENIAFIEVHEQEARRMREELLNKVERALEGEFEKPPVVVAMIGGALATWLGFKLNEINAYCQYVDVGAAFYAFSEKDALQRNWMKAYRRQISNAVSRMELSWPVSQIYSAGIACRNSELTDLISDAGVSKPLECNDQSESEPQCRPGFLENKLYSHGRIKQVLSLSVQANQHANYGPVVELLERVVHRALALPECRRVVAVNSGTSALYVATAVNQILAREQAFTWATSRFGFFSVACGGLSHPLLLDCNAEGRLDEQQFKALPADQYDGLVYTNVFSQHSNWGGLYHWCKKNGKRMVVDNATGLFDRPDVNYEEDAPIEIVSCHHTKPWGVGEGGFLICNQEEESIARKLINFGVGLDGWNWLGSNYKLSDLSASAIIDRLELMEYWQPFYQWQERRVKSLVIDSGLPLKPLTGETKSLSPRAYTPFVAAAEVKVLGDMRRSFSRKYYVPLGGVGDGEVSISQASQLYSRIVCISNNPFNRALSNEEYIELLRKSLSFQEGG